MIDELVDWIISFAVAVVIVGSAVFAFAFIWEIYK